MHRLFFTSFLKKIKKDWSRGDIPLISLDFIIELSNMYKLPLSVRKGQRTTYSCTYRNGWIDHSVSASWLLIPIPYFSRPVSAAAPRLLLKTVELSGGPTPSQSEASTYNVKTCYLPGALGSATFYRWLTLVFVLGF